MAIEESKLRALIEDGIPDATVRIEDLRGDGDHYAAYVTSPVFKGKSRVEQHKMVNAALEDVMKSQLHALAIQTSVPEE